ncbi:MAG TPA: c-type cytochrome [Xanthobacteraceae bacterium]|nr:c-type cytochrome [Xanthobacteraceae bacterium]
MACAVILTISCMQLVTGARGQGSQASQGSQGNQGSQHSQDSQVAKGRELALMVCSACHIVAPKQELTPILRPPAPPFEVIAMRPRTTAESLSGFLATNHKAATAKLEMPDPMLVDYQIGEVVSYILSLRRKPASPTPRAR